MRVYAGALIFAAGAAAAASSRTITAASFVKAADMSQLPQFDCDLTCNQYKSEAGAPASDALVQLAQAGLTHVRSRVWVNPSIPDNSYANLTGVLYLAKRIDTAGLKLWLDFHYSDWWADPGKQNKPAAWSNLSYPDLVTTVQSYSAAVVQALVDQGTPPDIIQVGNEINSGMLWPTAGQSCSDSGALYEPGCASEGPNGNWPQFAGLVAAGIAGVRSVPMTPPATVIIHTALGPDLATHVPYITGWYANLTTTGAGDWDGLGLSCYPHWGFGNTSNFARIADLIAALPPGKKVFVAETAFPYSGSVPGAQFPVTPAGQLAYIQSALSLSQQAGAAGLAWWGTEYTMGSGAGYTALWDQNYVALPALTQGWA